VLRRAHSHEPAPKISWWQLNRFPPTSLSIGCGCGQDAPTPAIRPYPIERPGSIPVQGSSTQDQLRQRNVLYGTLLVVRLPLVVALIAILAS